MNDKPSRNPDYPLRDKWYNAYKFPLVPQLFTRPANEYNTSKFTFEWLFIKVWSMDSPSFEIGINCDTHFGIGITGMLPYLRFVLCIPLPNKVGEWSMRNLWRKPKSHKSTIII